MTRPAAYLLAGFVTAVPVTLAAQTPDLPPRKAGLWEIASSFDEAPVAVPPILAQECVDPASDLLADQIDAGIAGLLGGQCQRRTTKRDDRAYVIEEDCTFGPTAARFRTVLSGDRESSYTERTQGTIKLGMETLPIVERRTAKWKSTDCAGMSPGDVRAFGITTNIRRMQRTSAFGLPGRGFDQLPPRRPGQWEVERAYGVPGAPADVPGGSRSPPDLLCIDPATDRSTMEAGLMLLKGSLICTANDIERVGDEWVLDDTCDLGSLKTTTKITISGDFQSTIVLREIGRHRHHDRDANGALGRRCVLRRHGAR
jgi:hypothetical protein